MGTSPTIGLTQDLQKLFGVGTIGSLSDGHLLGRFAAHRDEAAFEALVQRHGPMVWGVCRRILRDRHDAEDAFQATFLVLARKAPSIAHRELVAHWLYAVAYKSAVRARALTSKRRAREQQVTEMPEPEAEVEATRDDLLFLLDRELCRLPDKYRVPIVLCELEGKTHREAAEQLGWPIGTVSGRLSRARAMLASRLSRPGVTLSVGSLAVLLAGDAASASMPTKLVVSTAQAAGRSGAGRAVAAGVVSVEVATLVKGVLRTMLLSKIKIVSAGLLVLALTSLGVVTASSAPTRDHASSDTKAEAGAEESAVEDKVRLQGTWIVTNANQERGKEQGENGEFTVKFEKNRIVINKYGRKLSVGFTLAPKRNPKGMILERLSGSFKDRYAPAIYRLQGDILMMSVGRPGDEEPPADFSTKNDPETTPSLLVLKRKWNVREKSQRLLDLELRVKDLRTKLREAEAELHSFRAEVIGEIY